MTKKKIFKIIIYVIGGLLVLAVGYFGGEGLGFNKGYGNGYNAGYTDGLDTLNAAASLNPSNAIGNPLDKMPTANPFEEKVNPFE
jgi:hypothetical protein